MEVISKSSSTGEHTSDSRTSPIPLTARSLSRQPPASPASLKTCYRKISFASASCTCKSRSPYQHFPWSTISLTPSHRITCLFSSLCMHTISLQRSKDTTRRLAENRAQMCLIGLKEMQKYWEVNNLVLELFFQYLDESTAKTLRPSEVELGPDTAPVNYDSSISAMQASSVSENTTSTLYNDGQGLQSPGGLGLAMDDTLLSDTPQSVLCQNITSDPFEFFLDSQARINDGLDMQGLQFLHRCL